MRAVGQHAVDVAGQQAHAARAPASRRASGALRAAGRAWSGAQRHTTRARKRSCRCSAPTSRSSRVDDEQLGDLRRRLHQLARIDRQPVGRRSSAACASSPRRPAPRAMSRGALEAAAQVAVGEDAGDAPVAGRRPPSCPCPCRSSRGPRPAASRRWRRSAAPSPLRITSRTRVSSRRPSAPPGCERAKSSTEKPRASSSATASASPSASAAVVLAVGARSSGQASSSTAASRCTSAACASEECALPVIAMIARALALDVRRQRAELVGLAGVRQHQHDVVARDHAEVAVLRLGGMHEERRRAGRRERRGDLARDVPGLADAGDDDAAAAARASARRRRRTAPPSRCDSARIACGLDGEHVARQRQRAVRVDGSRCAAPAWRRRSSNRV